jgi:hypothetical protein
MLHIEFLRPCHLHGRSVLPHTTLALTGTQVTICFVGHPCLIIGRWIATTIIYKNNASIWPFSYCITNEAFAFWLPPQLKRSHFAKLKHTIDTTNYCHKQQLKILQSKYQKSKIYQRKHFGHPYKIASVRHSSSDRNLTLQTQHKHPCPNACEKIQLVPEWAALVCCCRLCRFRL